MLYFVRHGESQANLAGQRILDADIRIDQIVSSPLERAYKTAAIIAGCLGVDLSEILIDARLVEYDVGGLTGEPTQAVTAAQLVRASGAEDPAVFRQRVKAALKDAERSPGNGLIVSHGGVGQMIEATRQGLDPSRFFELESYLNGHVIELGDMQRDPDRAA